MRIDSLNDAEIFDLCQKYGAAARLWRQKFAGLLPEVYKRKLYFKKGFGSIFEFAAKLAGMSEEQVRRVLNLEKRFVATPLLKSLLENGEVSINKLSRVASIATVDNQEILAEQVRVLPKAAIETLVKDSKNLRVPGHTNLQLSDEVQSKLLELQEKGIDINRLILEFINKREIGIAQEKEQLSAEAPITESRYIPAKIRSLIKKEHGEKCSINGCIKAAATIHHTQRFSIGRSHDPKFLAPLCKNHHILAHRVDAKFLSNL